MFLGDSRSSLIKEAAFLQGTQTVTETLAKMQRLTDGEVPMFNMHLQSLYLMLKNITGMGKSACNSQKTKARWLGSYRNSPSFFFKEKYKKGGGTGSGRSWGEKWM